MFFGTICHSREQTSEIFQPYLADDMTCYTDWFGKLYIQMIFESFKYLPDICEML